MRDKQHHILIAGRHGPDGPRGEVVRYPRAIDYFRRSLARVSVDPGVDPGADPGDRGDDPAAKLLAMTQRLLSPGHATAAEPDLRVPRSRA